MGWRGTLVLAALLLVAGAYAYFDAFSGQRDVSLRALMGTLRPTPPGQDAPSLLDYEPDEIAVIRVRRGDLDLRVERRGGKWMDASRPHALNDFLANLRSLAEIMTVDVTEQDLSDYGLDPPEAIVDLERAGGDNIALRIGSHNPPATGVYVQMGSGTPVILTGALVLWELEKAIDAASP